MAAASRLGKQISEIITALDQADIRFALIGGLALASYKVIRATQDIDLLVDTSESDKVDAALTKLRYRCLHRSSDAGNYLRSDERVDLLYASREISRRLLAGAIKRKTSFGMLPVIGPEGLIGFKLQALANDPRRT
ncbi:MAG: nucleotidyltransferase domain-containing protein [Gammaproteobacteria bacterium]